MTRSPVIFVLMTALLLTGCRLGPAGEPAGQMPADFSMVVNVPGGMVREPARYVLQPDRWLRVALGPGAATHRFPPRTAQLSPREMQRVYELAVAARQVSQRSGSRSGNSGLQVYWPGEAVRFSLPTSNSAARALIERLRDLRGG